MKIHVSKSPHKLGEMAGSTAAEIIRSAIAEKGTANVILATGTSQIDTLKQVTKEKNINWSKVNLFYLDEYIGLPVTHPASFRKYLKENLLIK